MMRRANGMIRACRFAIAALAVSGCAQTNMPAGNIFPVMAEAPTRVSIFADANGTLYPAGWQQKPGIKAVKRQRSLLNAADPATREWIKAQVDQQRDQIAALAASKRRVFILVHGYRMDEGDAANAFSMLEERLELGNDDIVIRLHWDGMLGHGLGMGTAWFPATGYSQMVGIHALRPILDRLSGKDIYLISHSRGASVVLSALAAERVSFNPDFRAETQDILREESIDGAPLLDNGNRIHAILLAPAIGYPDFWAGRCQPDQGEASSCAPIPKPPVDCANYRDFTPQLRSIGYTLNSGDQTLAKYVRPIGKYFNATDFGWNQQVGDSLEACYPGIDIHAEKIAAPHSHDFRRYVQDPEFAVLLERAVNGAARGSETFD